MRMSRSRRSFLGCLGAAAVGTGMVSGGSGQASGFTPSRNGYGFRNWSTESQDFEAPPDPSEDAISEHIRSSWSSQARSVLGTDVGAFTGPVADVVAAQVRASIAQRAGTNGHCYGMVLTAQRYFEDPDAIPIDKRVASEIQDPTEPLDGAETPIYDEILERQTGQFLDFRVWLGRRAMFYPGWLDTDATLADVESVVETYGTAAVTVFNDTLYGHQVLAYDVRREGNRVVVPIYDPNIRASNYVSATSELVFRGDGDDYVMEPYREYTHMLFNRYDRIEASTDRSTATPIDHLRVDESRLRDALFPLGVVVRTSGRVELEVVGPDGGPLDRTRGRFMDRTRGDHTRIRAAYGVPPGTYRITVYGTEAGTYELSALAGGADGDGHIDATRSASIDHGAVHEYSLELSPDGTGTLTRVARTVRPVAVIGGGIAGLAAGALGYRAYLRTRERSEGPGEP